MRQQTPLADLRLINLRVQWSVKNRFMFRVSSCTSALYVEPRPTIAYCRYTKQHHKQPLLPWEVTALQETLINVDCLVSTWRCWHDCKTPFTRYSRLSNRLRLYRVNKHPTGCQPCWTNSHCSFNRLPNRLVQRVWQPAVHTIQPVVKPVVKRVWQPVDCLYTRYNRLSSRFDNRFDNRLYRVYKHLSLTGC